MNLENFLFKIIQPYPKYNQAQMFSWQFFSFFQNSHIAENELVAALKLFLCRTDYSFEVSLVMQFTLIKTNNGSLKKYRTSACLNYPVS